MKGERWFLIILESHTSYTQISVQALLIYDVKILHKGGLLLK